MYRSLAPVLARARLPAQAGRAQHGHLRAAGRLRVARAPAAPLARRAGRLPARRDPLRRRQREVQGGATAAGLGGESRLRLLHSGCLVHDTTVAPRDTQIDVRLWVKNRRLFLGRLSKHRWEV